MTGAVQRSTPRDGKPNPHREEALDRLRAGATVTAVAAWAGVHRATVTRWARAAGVDPATNTARTRAATEASAAVRASLRLEQIDEAGGRFASALTTAARLQDDALTAIAALPPDRFVLRDGVHYCHDRATRALTARAAYAATAAGVPLRDLVTGVTRAVHDLAALRGNGPDAAQALIVQIGIPQGSFAVDDARAEQL